MHTRCSAALLALACSLGAHSANADSWDFTIEPYLMGTQINGDATIGTVESQLEVDFDTILDNLDAAFMLHFEGYHESNWGFKADWAFMDLSKSHTTPRMNILDARVRQGVLELAVAYRHYSPSVGKWVNYIGIRRWDNEYEFNLTPGAFPEQQLVDRDEDWIDLIFGSDYRYKLNEHWDLIVIGDIGGLGLSSDLTGSLQLGATWKFAENWGMNMKYKGTYVDYDDGTDDTRSAFEYKTWTHGPILSVSYQF